MQRSTLKHVFLYTLTVVLCLYLSPIVRGELVGYWPLDGDLSDYSGLGNDGELVGDPEFSDDVSDFFASGQSMFFDGDDAVLLGNPSVLDFGVGDWTMSAWAKKVAGSDRGNVYSNGGDNGGGVRSVLAIGETGGAQAVVLTLDVDQGTDAKRQAVSTDETEGFPLINAEDEQWNHIVGMRSGLEARVYVNGELADTISLREDPPYDMSGMSQLPSYIGVGADAASDPIGGFLKWFNGNIDEVAIWNEALDGETIQLLANGRGVVDEPENPGDFNLDGSVDLADFMIMAENFNQTFPITESFAKGDQTRDGRVNLDDFREVREIFNGAAGGTAAAVPEPSGLGLIGLGMFAMFARRRRRRA